MTEILFHPADPGGPRSIGRQTLSPKEYTKLLQALGKHAELTCTLVDVNELAVDAA